MPVLVYGFAIGLPIRRRLKDNQLFNPPLLITPF